MTESGGNKKIKGLKCFYFLVGSILLLSAEKRTKRSNVRGLKAKKKSYNQKWDVPPVNDETQGARITLNYYVSYGQLVLKIM